MTDREAGEDGIEDEALFEQDFVAAEGSAVDELALQFETLVVGRDADDEG